MPPSVFFEFSQSWSDQVPLILYSFFLHLLPYCIKPCSSWCSTSTSRLMLHNNSWHSVLFHSSKLSILHLVKISRPIFHSIHYIPFFCFSFLYRNCILKSKTKQQQKKIRFVSPVYFFIVSIILLGFLFSFFFSSLEIQNLLNFFWQREDICFKILVS